MPEGFGGEQFKGRLKNEEGLLEKVGLAQGLGSQGGLLRRRQTF